MVRNCDPGRHNWEKTEKFTEKNGTKLYWYKCQECGKMELEP